MVNILENTYKGKKIFLTGHTGFKGTWLLCWLKELGAEVIGYSLAPENSTDLFHQVQGNQLCEKSIIADINDQVRLEKELLAAQPDFVFHLAAQPLVRLSYDIPLQTMATNALGTGYVLEALRKLNKPCVTVIVTTDKVYKNLEKHYAYREEDALGGYDPYSASKAMAEIVVDSYRNSFFNPSNYDSHQQSISSARAGNVIGGGDWAKDRIIPDIIKALEKGKDVIVRNPNSIRPWQHVLEPLSGYLTLGAKQYEDPIKYAGEFNFGPNPQDNLTVGELVEYAISIYGKGKMVCPVLDNQPHEAGLLMLDNEKAKKQLQWEPKWNAQTAISRTINWYIKPDELASDRLLIDINNYCQ